MDRCYEQRIATGDALVLPSSSRALLPISVYFQGPTVFCLGEGTSVGVEFGASNQGIAVVVEARPSTKRAITQMNHQESRAVAEWFGRIRVASMPFYLKSLTAAFRDKFVERGKRPFWRYPIRPQGKVLPLSYQPYGPWKLEPLRDPFDLTTSASLTLPRRYLRDQPLADLLENLYSSRLRFVSPATFTVGDTPVLARQ